MKKRIIISLVLVVFIIIMLGIFVSRNSNKVKNENKANSNSNIVVNNTTEVNEKKEENINSSSNKIENNKAEESDKKEEKANNTSLTTNNSESKKNDGYEIIVSKKELTIEKGKEASFDITFTNPDESSIREYIKCEDQSEIITVKYTPLENKKITVEVEALKEGETEILVCDYNYPDRKEIVKVNVVE